MSTLLVIDDQSKDMRIAEQIGVRAGFSNVEGQVCVLSAVAKLEKGLRGEVPLPDAIVLDLDFGLESGYELLRVRRQSPRLMKIGLIVWTQLGPENREICGLFQISGYVSKWEGIEVLRGALESVMPQTCDS